MKCYKNYQFRGWEGDVFGSGRSLSLLFIKLWVVNMASFVAIYKYLLRGIMNPHLKVPIEQLYLEMGALSSSYVICARRLIDLQTILKRYTSDLIWRIFVFQKASQLPSDWCQSVAKGFEIKGKHIEGKETCLNNEHDYSTCIKNQARKATFSELEEISSNHHSS